LRFLPGPKGSDLVHPGLSGGIDGNFHDADAGGPEFEWNAPSLDHLGEEQPDGRRNVEADFVQHLASFCPEVFFNPNLQCLCHENACVCDEGADNASAGQVRPRTRNSETAALLVPSPFDAPRSLRAPLPLPALPSRTERKLDFGSSCALVAAAASEPRSRRAQSASRSRRSFRFEPSHALPSCGSARGARCRAVPRRRRAALSTSPNGVRVQIWTALCAYLLVAIAKQRQHLPHSLWEILQIVSVASMEQVPLHELLADIDTRNDHFIIPNQLEFNYS
jgi:hypothetical protein